MSASEAVSSTFQLLVKDLRSMSNRKRPLYIQVKNIFFNVYFNISIYIMIKHNPQLFRNINSISVFKIDKKKTCNNLSPWGSGSTALTFRFPNFETPPVFTSSLFTSASWQNIKDMSNKLTRKKSIKLAEKKTCQMCQKSLQSVFLMHKTPSIIFPKINTYHWNIIVIVIIWHRYLLKKILLVFQVDL